MKCIRKKGSSFFIIAVLILAVGLVAGCGTVSNDNIDGTVKDINNVEKAVNKGDLEMHTEKISYEQITAKEAKEIMNQETWYVILDVRTEEEYAEGHIENAILIPDYEIENRAEQELADKEQLILVYCRSGRRSKVAAQKLADIGYSNVKEFGGITDWSYGVVTE